MADRNNAQSLSDIIRIASNPPNYPRNPAAIPREPLILYISRVPGTRDIILSTSKPLMKNVTVEDITTCLYYLHFNTDTDIQRSREVQPEETLEPIRKSLSRKPVPQPSLKSIELSDSSQKDQPSGVLTPKSHSIRRKPVGEPASRTSSEYPRNQSRPRRRSLDSRPPSCAPVSNRKLILATLKKHDQQVSTYPPLKPQISAEPHPKTRENTTEIFPGKDSEEVFSITVVRRDPSSGAQWNVGIISGHPATEEALNGRSSTRRSRKPYFDISLYLTTPGYLHFRDQTSDIGINPSQVPEPQHQNLQKPRFAFERKVLMEGSSFWSRASVQRKRALSDLSDKYSATLRARNHDEIVDNHEVHDTKVSQSKGYVFISPWGGRCKFFTGSGGRSLLCQHTLPSPVSAGDSGLRQQAVVISELRFNIPGSSLFTSPKPMRENNGPYFENLSKYSNLIQTQNKLVDPKLTSHTHMSQSISALYTKFEKQVSHRLYKDTEKRKLKKNQNNDDKFPEKSQNYSTRCVDETRLNLSVGREKAGGGSRGTHAKMGKIIVHDEGLKMLDLVVCANMAIWWSVWDSDSKST